MRISDWSSDVCSSDLLFFRSEGTIGVVTAASLRLVPAITDRAVGWIGVETPEAALALFRFAERVIGDVVEGFEVLADDTLAAVLNLIPGARCPTATRSPWYVLIEVDLDSAEGPSAHERLETALAAAFTNGLIQDARSEEHTSELQSLMRHS